jgi:CTP:molybdopterin cytidylyltransferase MocA
LSQSQVWRAAIVAAEKPGSVSAGGQVKDIGWATPVDGIPALARTFAVLQRAGFAAPIVVSASDEAIARRMLARDARYVRFAAVTDSPAASALAAANIAGEYPILLAGADRALLTPRMIAGFVATAASSGADFVAGLVPAVVVAKAYPDMRHRPTVIGGDQFHSAHLYAVMNEKGLDILNLLSGIEENKMRVGSLVSMLGLFPWLRFASGGLGLSGAAKAIRRKTGASIGFAPIDSAEAAIDTASKEGHALAESILAMRKSG